MQKKKALDVKVYFESLTIKKQLQRRDMSYFPAYMKMDDKNIIIIGAGNIAYEKLTRLLDFTQNITILSEHISKQVEKVSKSMDLKLIKKRYKEGDIDSFDIVIVAVDDIGLQKKIYSEAKQKHILCNSVDSVEYCDFIFPSYIKKGDLIVSVSTSGASPSVAKYLRRYIEKAIPNDMDNFIKKMKQLRNTMPKGRLRMKFLDEMVKRYFEDRSKS